MVCCFNCGHYDCHKDYNERRDCGYKLWAYNRSCKKFYFKWPDRGGKVIIDCGDCGSEFEGKMHSFGGRPYRCPDCIQKKTELREKVGFDRRWKDCRWCSFSHRVNQFAGFCSLNVPGFVDGTNSVSGMIKTTGIYRGDPFMIYESYSFDAECWYFSFTHKTLNDGLISMQLRRARDDEHFRNVMEAMGVDSETGKPIIV